MPTNGTAPNSWKPLLICPHVDLARKLGAVWREAGERELVVESRRYPGQSALRELVSGNAPDICFLDIATDREVALGLITELKGLRIPVVALHTGYDSDAILSCLRQGAAEFLHLPFSAGDLGSALERLAKRVQAAAAQARSGGEVYCLMRGKSGCGSTTIACNLAFQLRTLNFQKILLADLDPLTGTIAFLLKLNSHYSFVHAIANSSRMDEALWKGLVSPSHGVDVLLSPDSPVDLVYEAEDLAAMVDYWRRLYEFVILDTPGPHRQWGLELAKLSDEVLLVTTNELPAVHATQNSLACLRHNGISPSKTKLVVNRYNTDIGLSSQAIETALDLQVFHHLPSDFEGVQKALMEGKPVPGNSKVGKGIAELAEKLTGRKRAPKNRSLFGGLFSLFETF